MESLVGGSITAGQRVETFDHRSAGVVQAVNDDRILIKPAVRSAFWINEILVRAVSRDRVQLHVDKRGLRRYGEPVEVRHGPGSVARLRLFGCAAVLGALATSILVLF